MVQRRKPSFTGICTFTIDLDGILLPVTGSPPVPANVSKKTYEIRELTPNQTSSRRDRAAAMGFALTASDVAEYAAKPFVRAALAQPRSPNSVLSFFLGVDMVASENEKEGEAARAQLSSGEYLRRMTPFWFAGHDDYDTLCSNSFRSLVREAGKKELVGEWMSTVNGQVAQMVLCDQLSRNAFRGSDEAYAYDETALDIAKLLASEVIFPDNSATTSSPMQLQGTFYPTYCAFALTTLMHSEDQNDHALGLSIFDWAIAETPPSLKDEWWDLQMGSFLEHSNVLDRFGRYPHRNAKKGRKSTKEEEEWLSKVDELPGWAKSQL
jgi:uncharacterized protein (DUF924 family)